ncbi:cobaltochelatase CobT-related protein [Parerythrobacter lacustris]|uniref:Cobalamin biosynthesis protein CobT VWA domain-containing protein n=1 Tax=Parerythrobacter lacustris TaxID=2969984 RepID=A0ABT1XU83_9SPHN|nr:hypothetical protein [Parerythrobacter lacustris]MCR2835243.1 hypothetical protein [Parerythrobacter lacustris]
MSEIFSMPNESDRLSNQYRVYTSRYDRIVDADELGTVLESLSHKNQRLLDEAWDEFQTGLLPWKTKLTLSSRELSERINLAIPRDRRESTIVSLLFDQSGSMRGQKMLYSAAAADVAQEFLATLKIGCEVLGFTTSAWCGGRSRRLWNWRLRPRNPGRLNDLLHVVFRDGLDDRASTGNWAFRHMLRPDFPKENIDGEAIQWAVSRLGEMGHSRKILIVLSDGAPVDDSTLSENDASYLIDHLEFVVEELNRTKVVEMAAFGIGCKAHPFYPRSRHVDAPADIGLELLRFITEILCDDKGEVLDSTGPKE